MINVVDESTEGGPPLCSNKDPPRIAMEEKTQVQGLDKVFILEKKKRKRKKTPKMGQ